MSSWLVFSGMAAVTYLTRVTMILLLSQELPRPVAQWLQLVPVAVLCALIAPAVLVLDRQLALGPQVPAAVVGALVAWRTRSVLLTIMAGMVCYWILLGLL